MDNQFYLQDSQEYIGDGLSSWALGGGHCTDLARLEVFTRSGAIRHHEDRESDLPWPKAYVDARAYTGIDCQYIREEDAVPLIVVGATLVVQSQRNGNNVYWLGWHCRPGPDFTKAVRVSDQAGLDAAKADGLIPAWSLKYIEGKAWRLANRQDVSI